MSYLAQVWRNRCALGVHSPQNVHGASAFRGICFLLFSMLSFDALVQSASVAGPKVEHQGVCPNKLNGNLWVDAQSICDRECNIDEDCAEFEKCCTNVCGLNSCVAARFSDGPPAQPEGQDRGTGDGGPATCQGFLCSQQGATCDIWEGQPICKCQDRCEKEPNFTCASDGLTYFNHCYMDAEACIRGGTLTVVTCRFYLAGPPTSLLPTAFPTPTSSLEDALPPTLFSNPPHQSIYVGGTVSSNRFETYEECRASCQREGTGTCSLPAVQGPCKSWEARWAWNSLIKQCQAFAYGGCHGNLNNFRSKKECEANCPQPKNRPCRTCRVKGKMVSSLCRSDFAFVGRLTELIEDLDSGIARFSLEEVLRDKKMGLSFFNTKHLEVTLAKMDWSCPCPNITVEESPWLVMGVVQDGMAIIQPDSYVRTITDRRLRKVREALSKNTCDV